MARSFLQADDATVYLDDIFPPWKNVSESLQKLKTILQRLRRKGLTLNLKKWSFLVMSFEDLGSEILKTEKRKTKAVSEFATATNSKQVRQFFESTEYFWHFVKNYALIAKPLPTLQGRITHGCGTMRSKNPSHH